MNWLKRFGAFWYDFVVGDDWRLAVGTVLGLAVVGVLVRSGHNWGWWLLPAVVVATLGISLKDATRRSDKRGSVR